MSMENQREASQLFWLFVVLVGGAGYGFASDPPVPQPVATLALSAAQSSGNEESASPTVAVSSETSIAVGVCRQDCRNQKCSLSLVGWEGGTLRLFAPTTRFNTGVSIHSANEGRILAGQSWLPTLLYSADVSAAPELPKHVSHVSPSGKTETESVPGSWKLYRLTDRLEPLREGTGEPRSVSDEMVVIQDGRVIRIETLDGERLGSFSAADEEWGSQAALLGNTKLYLDDCRRGIKVVDSEGKTQLKMHSRGACDQGNRSFCRRKAHAIRFHQSQDVRLGKRT
jgi:hypothetical protein